ncbi:hypothetical protein GLU60_01000 [Nanohaloarchaea archaeon H01]|nr:hypothetical protein [Nanohaloarchaea archaeon H01]
MVKNCMLCVAYLVVFGILGIFSSTHRELFIKSLECVKNSFKRRPCEADVKQEVRANITHSLIERNPRIAKFVNQYFDVLSWVFIILFIASTALTISVIVDLIIHGSCNPSKPSGCPVNAHQSGLLGDLI